MGKKLRIFCDDVNVGIEIFYIFFIINDIKCIFLTVVLNWMTLRGQCLIGILDFVQNSTMLLHSS